MCKPIIKELVHIGEDKDQTLSLNYTGLIPVLVKAIQDQQDIIDTQNKKIDELSSLEKRVIQIESLLNNEKL